MTRHLRRLGDQFRISLPLADGGFLGRQCPNEDCQRYFKIKPGTGLEGENLPLHCPYCGQTGEMGDFHTQAQLDYAVSMVGRQVTEAATRDLKDMARQFNRRAAGGLFSLKMDVKSSPSPIRHYAEEELETDVECQNCTLVYSVYGVFAYCPDCGQHNSLQILGKGLDVVVKMLDMACSADAEVAATLVQNGLEDCVSAFDGFGRELCKIHSSKAKDQARAEAIRFQNIAGARTSIAEQFGIDLAQGLHDDEWSLAARCFQKRHLLAHKMGVIDKEYVQRAGDPSAVVGRKISVTPDEVRELTATLRQVASLLVRKMEALS